MTSTEVTGSYLAATNLDGKGAQSLDVLLALRYHVLQVVFVHVQAKVFRIIAE